MRKRGRAEGSIEAVPGMGPWRGVSALSMSIEQTSGYVLVCDDEAPIRRIVADRLRRAGLEVREARDGHEGFEAALERVPMLVVTDLQMPGLDGVGMCKRLRAEPTTAGVRAVLLTARGHLASPEELASTGIVRVVRKPFSVNELAKVVAELIGPAASGSMPARAA